MKYALIDLGSNTIRLAVYHAEQGLPVCLYTKKIFARAVSYKQKHVMSAQGIQVITNALTELVRHASHSKPDALWCFATACLRGLDNLTDVLNAVYAACGLHVDVLSGDMEARLGVKALTAVHKVTDALCIDLGGGSCEISLITNGQTTNAASLDIGSVSAGKDYVTHVFPDSGEINQLGAAVDAMLQNLTWLRGCGRQTAYGLGGSARAMCRLHHALTGRSQFLDDACISASAMAPLYRRLCDMQTEGIRLADQHCPGRVFTVIPGIVILDRIMTFSGAQHLCPSSASVRDGYLLHKLGRP